MINWNEVVVGETEIVDHAHMRFIVAGLFEKSVWLIQDYDKYSIIRDREALVGWTIYDPWVEITDQCEWKQLEMSRHLWKLLYQGKPLFIDDVYTKTDGRRVWIRKEQLS